MPVTGTAISSAVNALRLYSRRVDRAAEQIAKAGLVPVASEGSGDPEEPVAPISASAAESSDLGEAMVNMMIAQRAFSAQLRVLRTADEMLKESVDATGRR